MKNPNPLWMNPDFFIHLPFKKNEDVNSTKVSNKEMNLEHLALAKQEFPHSSLKVLLNPFLPRGLVKPFMLTSMLSKSKENLDW